VADINHWIFVGYRAMGTILAGSTHHARSLNLLAHTRYYLQLAEAILSEPSVEDDMSIRLTDTRTRRRSVVGRHSEEQEEEERQFLVEAEEEPDAASVEGEDEEMRPIVSNVAARLSFVDVTATNGDVHGNDEHDNEPNRTTGGLSAQAGIILVGFHLEYFAASLLTFSL
jgi:hypothetical protein